jgi:hypothetical protein
MWFLGVNLSFLCIFVSFVNRMFDFEILSPQSPIKLASSPDEGFADLNVMDLVQGSDYITSTISPQKDTAARKQLNLGMCLYVCSG